MATMRSCLTSKSGVLAAHLGKPLRGLSPLSERFAEGDDLAIKMPHRFTEIAGPQPLSRLFSIVAACGPRSCTGPGTYSLGPDPTDRI